MTEAEELAQLRKIIEPLIHKAKGDYNKWAHGKSGPDHRNRDSYNYSEAMEALRKLKV